MKWIDSKNELPNYGKKVLGSINYTVKNGGGLTVELVSRTHTDRSGEHWEVLTNNQSCEYTSHRVEWWAEIPKPPISSSDTDSGK